MPHCHCFLYTFGHSSLVCLSFKFISLKEIVLCVNSQLFSIPQRLPCQGWLPFCLLCLQYHQCIIIMHRYFSLDVLPASHPQPLQSRTPVYEKISQNMALLYVQRQFYHKASSVHMARSLTCMCPFQGLGFHVALCVFVLQQRSVSHLMCPTL